jgi:hypothetical protein
VITRARRYLAAAVDACGRPRVLLLQALLALGAVLEATVLLLLVDEGYMARDGQLYRLIEAETRTPEAETRTPGAGTRKAGVSTMETRKELKRQYLETPKQAGIFQQRRQHALYPPGLKVPYVEVLGVGAVLGIGFQIEDLERRGVRGLAGPGAQVIPEGDGPLSMVIDENEESADGDDDIPDPRDGRRPRR